MIIQSVKLFILGNGKDVQRRFRYPNNPKVGVEFEKNICFASISKTDTFQEGNFEFGPVFRLVFGTF